MIREIQKLIHTDYNGSIRSDTLLYSAGYENENNAHVIVLKGYCVTRSRYTTQMALPLPFPSWCWPIQSDQTASHSFPNPDKQFWVATCISKSGCLGKTLEDTTHLFLRHSKPKSCSENEDPDVQFFSHVFVAKNNNNFQQHQGWMKMQFLDSIENYSIIQTSC